MFLRRIFLVLAALLSGTGVGFSDTGGERLPAPFGDFRVIAVRPSQDVAAVFVPGAGIELLGRRVRFGEEGLTWIDGSHCRRWIAAESDTPLMLVDDANLADLQVPPVDPSSARDDRRLNITLDLKCLDAGEERIATLLMVDQRVLVTPVENSTVNAILERPLDEAEIKRLQGRLREMKFHYGGITGRLDESTLRAVATYSSYRRAVAAGRGKEADRFARTAITENLLDKLRVLEATGGAER
ncbi:MAG: hypothetical protein Kow006_18630 [Gammaproteobacteria bacterium]